jgi:O-antigen/teichoic acid export membrane protein
MLNDMPAFGATNGTPGTVIGNQPRATRLVPSIAEVRQWGAKSAVTLIDQTLTSAAGFGANVLLARWMSAADYGAFVVAFAAYLFLTGFHNALLLEPASVIGPARHSKHLAIYFQSQFRVHGLLVWPLAGLSLVAAIVVWRAAPHSPLIGALIGGGLALPMLLLLWLARRMAYVLQSPQLAVAGSLVYFVLTMAALFALRGLDRVTPANALLALGIASVAGSFVILHKANARQGEASGREHLSVPAVLRENWHYGRWLVGSALFYSIATSTPTFIAASILGLNAAGVLRAMQIPSLVMTQIVAAIGLLVLPALSYDFGRRDNRLLLRKAILASSGLGSLALGFAVCLAIFSKPIEHILFGGKYASYAGLIPILALIPAANGLSTGFSMALRASQKPHCDSAANGVAAAVSLISVFVLTPRFGLFGVATSLVLGFIAMNLTSLIFFLRLKQTLTRESSDHSSICLGDEGKAASQTETDLYASLNDYV